MTAVLMTGLPMPPSSNHAYPTIMMGGRPVRVEGKELKAFNRAMKDWRLENLSICNEARRLFVSKFQSDQGLIRVDRYFAFPRKQLYTLAGLPKRMDASNRIKALDDALAEHILTLDDSWFVSGLCEKVLTEDDRPSVSVVLRYAKQKSIEELLKPCVITGKPMILWSHDG